MDELNIIGFYYARYADGRLYERGIVRDQFMDGLQLQRARIDGTFGHIFTVPLKRIDNNFMFHETSESLNATVSESEYADSWVPFPHPEKPFTAGLASLGNENVHPIGREYESV